MQLIMWPFHKQSSKRRANILTINQVGQKALRCQQRRKRTLPHRLRQTRQSPTREKKLRRTRLLLLSGSHCLRLPDHQYNYLHESFYSSLQRRHLHEHM